MGGVLSQSIRTLTQPIPCRPRLKVQETGKPTLTWPTVKKDKTDDTNCDIVYLYIVELSSLAVKTRTSSLSL